MDEVADHGERAAVGVLVLLLVGFCIVRVFVLWPWLLTDLVEVLGLVGVMVVVVCALWLLKLPPMLLPGVGVRGGCRG